MTLRELHSDSSLLLLKCISGSQSYGLALPHSDIDIKGVYILPKKEFYGLTFTDQVNNDTNDEVYFEVKKFIDLLSKNNPNILELLSTPEDCILHIHPVMNDVKADKFLSRLCNHSFAGYAYAQIKKARGLNKKILNPIDQQRKSILDFCYVVHEQSSISLQRWLEIHHYNQKDCGLVRIDHMRDIYAIYHTSQFQEAVLLQGISSGEDANNVSLSSIPNGIIPRSILSFNKDGYSVYCREYKEYWDWVNKRNEERYSTTISHGKNYDSKNMMHVFRLLNMAEEIARYKQVNVRRKEREWLLRVRAGEFLYEDLLKQAEEKIALIDELFKHSDLPDAPDITIAEELLVTIRETCY
jgi:uncharacterized protein